MLQGINRSPAGVRNTIFPHSYRVTWACCGVLYSMGHGWKRSNRLDRPVALLYPQVSLRGDKPYLAPPSQKGNNHTEINLPILIQMPRSQRSLIHLGIGHLFFHVFGRFSKLMRERTQQTNRRGASTYLTMAMICVIILGLLCQLYFPFYKSFGLIKEWSSDELSAETAGM